MATNTKLNMVFQDANGKNITFPLNYADKTKAASVRPAMEAIVTNGDIFSTVPTALVSATFIETTETQVTL